MFSTNRLWRSFKPSHFRTKMPFLTETAISTTIFDQKSQILAKNVFFDISGFLGGLMRAYGVEMGLYRTCQSA